jgi:hypothetical protein
VNLRDYFVCGRGLYDVVCVGRLDGYKERIGRFDGYRERIWRLDGYSGRESE